MRLISRFRLPILPASVSLLPQRTIQSFLFHFIEPSNCYIASQ
ncbi:hypothetical protein [Rubritalea tangerina]